MEGPARGWWIAGALLVVYALWGSTFLGIRVAVETLPPLSMASARWWIAGGLLYLAVRPRGGSSWRAWGRSAALASLLVAASNGGVSWAETRVASGVAALAVASVSPWLVVLEALRPGGRRPAAGTVLGVGLGVAGVGLLVDPRAPVDPVAFAVLLGASFAFALGSTIARLAPDDGPPLVAVARQMVTGGAILAAAALATGERPVLSEVSAASAGALLWLAAFGSIAGYSVYSWLTRVAPPALVGTYACVNPVVALALGASLLDEPVGPRTLAAASLVVAGVALVTIGGPLWTGVDWLVRLTYPRPGGADVPDHDVPRRLVVGPGDAAPQAR